MLAIIKIFGGRAAMSEKFSGMTYADIMDDIFARSKSFSGKEYYDEMVRICPELKKKWWERSIKHCFVILRLHLDIKLD